jgi:hypothetical protein
MDTSGFPVPGPLVPTALGDSNDKAGAPDEMAAALVATALVPAAPDEMTGDAALAGAAAAGKRAN